MHIWNRVGAYMKIRGGIIFGIILLFVGLAFSPATGGVIEADDFEIRAQNNDETVSVYFWDITSGNPKQQVIEMTESEWTILQNDLREIKASSESLIESLNGQFSLFKQYGFITDDVTYGTLKEQADEKFKNIPHRPPREPLVENVIFNAVCAISFEMDDTSSTFVFGLNTFINLVGLNIISVHKGNCPSGISTLGGLLGQTADPGEYVGFMFGFLGYWAGTKTGTGTYTDLIVAGFTVTTTWLPLPS